MMASSRTTACGIRLALMGGRFAFRVTPKPLQPRATDGSGDGCGGGGQALLLGGRVGRDAAAIGRDYDHVADPRSNRHFVPRRMLCDLEERRLLLQREYRLFNGGVPALGETDEISALVSSFKCDTGGSAE